VCGGDGVGGGLILTFIQIASSPMTSSSDVASCSKFLPSRFNVRVLAITMPVLFACCGGGRYIAEYLRPGSSSFRYSGIPYSEWIETKEFMDGYLIVGDSSGSTTIGRYNDTLTQVWRTAVKSEYGDIYPGSLLATGNRIVLV